MTYRILVLGASGRTGRLVVAEALARGHEVTAFVRDPAKVAALGPKVAIVVGDVRDRAGVEAAAAGKDVVISALGMPVCAEGVRNAIAGMKRHGGRRLIALSNYGVGDSRHGFMGWMLNMVMGRLLADKEAMEQAIVGSGLDWTVLRLPVLTMGPKTAKVKASPATAVVGFSRVSRADVADYVVQVIDDVGTFGKVSTVTRG